MIGLTDTYNMKAVGKVFQHESRMTACVKRETRIAIPLSWNQRLISSLCKFDNKRLTNYILFIG